MTENEKKFEDFMKEQNKKKKQTIIWRVFSTACLVAIILLIIFRAMNCNCDCKTAAEKASSSYSVSSQVTDSTAPLN